MAIYLYDTCTHSKWEGAEKAAIMIKLSAGDKNAVCCGRPCGDLLIFIIILYLMQDATLWRITVVFIIFSISPMISTHTTNGKLHPNTDIMRYTTGKRRMIMGFLEMST